MASPSVTPPSEQRLELRPKRTRICGAQSKNGCFTCKTRRIKCDEEKPTCLRCSRSRRVCQGYPARASNDDEGAQNVAAPVTAVSFPGRTTTTPTRSSLSCALTDAIRTNPAQERLAALGCHVLKSNTYDKFGTTRPIWEYVLPQLSHAIPSVNAAAALLGVVYESQHLPSSVVASRASTIASLYSAALNSLQRDLVTQPHGPVPLLLICVLLGCSEILQRSATNALLHLQGAFQILRGRSILEGSPLVLTPESESSCEDLPETVTPKDPLPDDNLTFLFRSLDIQLASYALSRPPELPAFDHGNMAPLNGQPMTDVDDAERQLIPLVHSSYHFTAYAQQFKYLPRAAIDPETVITQSRHIARLSLWLEKLDHDILSTQSHKSLPFSELAHIYALKLRIMCLGMIIYVSTVMDPYEKSYDFHNSRFHQIVEDFTVIFRCRQKYEIDKSMPTRAGPTRFGPEPGVINPLFFVAIKCRHPVWRRQAIDLLRSAGMEGPWNGRTEAGVAARAVEIEEAENFLSFDPERFTEMASIQVPEKARLHGCGNSTDASSPRNLVKIMYSRCLNVDVMLASPKWDAEENWDIWHEEVFT